MPDSHEQLGKFVRRYMGSTEARKRFPRPKQAEDRTPKLKK